MRNKDFYHGGPIGRSRGCFILPPIITKAKSLAQFGANEVCRIDRVYITTDINAALLYASAHKNGVIYKVTPYGVLENDYDCYIHGLSFSCDRARVEKIIKPSKDKIELARNVLLYA